MELTGCPPALYAPVLEILEQMGCTVSGGADRAEVARFGRLYGAGRVFTGVYPGLATDAAPLLAAAMLCAEERAASRTSSSSGGSAVQRASSGWAGG